MSTTEPLASVPGTSDVNTSSNLEPTSIPEVVAGKGYDVVSKLRPGDIVRRSQFYQESGGLNTYNINLSFTVLMTVLIVMLLRRY